MLKRSISEYAALSLSLYDVGWFNPERLTDGAALFIVENSADALAVDDIGGAAVCFDTTEENAVRRFKPLFDDFPLAFVLIPDKRRCDEISDLLARLFPKLAQHIPKDGAFGEFRSLRDVIREGGEQAFNTLLVNTVQKAAYGLINLAEVPPAKRQMIALSGIRGLDRNINGFGAGQLSVWTGTRGSGKSTILGEIMLNAVDQDVNVFAYSGELTSGNFYGWITAQAAGRKHVKMETDPHSGKEYYVVDKGAEKQIRKWLDGKFFLYDNTIADASSADTILSVMTLAAMRYGCKMFLFDNLMTVQLRGTDYYREQSEFVRRLAEFSKKHNVHVHLVAHPRKTETGRTEGKNLVADDVGGSGDITNRADNVFSVKRVLDEDAGFDAGMTVLKNRDYGVIMQRVELCFDRTCNRLYERGSSADWRYGWETGFVELPQDTPMPF